MCILFTHTQTHTQSGESTDGAKSVNMWKLPSIRPCCTDSMSGCPTRSRRFGIALKKLHYANIVIIDLALLPQLYNYKAHMICFQWSSPYDYEQVFNNYA